MSVEVETPAQASLRVSVCEQVGTCEQGATAQRFERDRCWFGECGGANQSEPLSVETVPAKDFTPVVAQPEKVSGKTVVSDQKAVAVKQGNGVEWAANEVWAGVKADQQKPSFVTFDDAALNGLGRQLQQGIDMT